MPTMSLWDAIAYQGRVNALLKERGITPPPERMGNLSAPELQQLAAAHESGITPAAFVESILLARGVISRKSVTGQPIGLTVTACHTEEAGVSFAP